MIHIWMFRGINVVLRDKYKDIFSCSHIWISLESHQELFDLPEKCAKEFTPAYIE